jgi:hypothetical protein
MSEINTFSQEVRATGERYELPALTTLREILSRQAETFDIEELPKTLDYFPQLVKEIIRTVTDE